MSVLTDINTNKADSQIIDEFYCCDCCERVDENAMVCPYCGCLFERADMFPLYMKPDVPDK
jgi:hypothetical protein